MTDPREQLRHDPETEGETPSVDLGACVTGLVNAVSKGMAEEVEPYGLSPIEFSLLKACRAAGECTATELAAVLPVDASRVSRLVTRLVDRGLLVRRRLRNDRRIVMLRLSGQGDELTALLNGRIRQYDSRLTEDIGEEEMSVFESVTLKILANYSTMQSSQ